MFANPIIRRYRFSQLRPQQVWVFEAMYVCIVLLLLFINSSIYRYGEGAYRTPAELNRGLFVQFSVIQLFLLWLLCPANCSNVVAREIADKSFDFFRMLPVSATTKAVGILIGRNLFCLITAAINFCLCLLFAFWGQLSAAFIGQMTAVLFALTLALNLLAMLFSIITYKKSKATSMPVLLVIGVFAFGPIIGTLMNAVGQQKLENVSAFFFIFKMPVLYLVAGCALFVVLWAYIGVLRRFTYEYESLFTRAGAVLFVLTLMVVLIGLFYPFFFHYDGVNTARGFWIAGLVPLGIIPLFALRSFDKYLEISRTAHRTEGLFGKLLINSNGVTGLLLYLIWAIFAIIAAIIAKADLNELLWFGISAFLAYMIILALIETYVVWQPKNEKIGYLIAFAGGMYFFLPIILATLFDSEKLLLFSPLGLTQLFQYESEYLVMTVLAPVLVNLILATLLGLLIGKRYYDLITIRGRL